MALDAALARSAAERGSMTLRFYGWSEATLSLGYFQSWRDRAAHLSSRACPLVRRESGGGAIVHDRELTYSFAVPGMHRIAERTESLYHAIHASLISVLGQFDVRASFFGQQTATAYDRRAFLCFQRRSTGDVVVGDAKLAGSAQRRHKAAILQHGSLVLQMSPRAPEVPGLAEVAGVGIEPEQFVRQWVECLGSRLELDISPAELTDDELLYAQRLEADRYTTDSWNHRQ